MGSKIPSLRALMEEYDVAEGTVHSAIRQLQHAGVLESTAGRGTFVRQVPDENGPSLGDTVDSLRVEVADLRGRVEALERSNADRPS